MNIIYKITNKSTGNFYIGKTTKSISQRFYQHNKKAKYGHKTHLCNAIRKYGIDNFIIEEIDQSDKEVYWIEKLNPQYNMTSGGEGGDTSKSPNFIKAMENRNTSGERNPMHGKAGFGGKVHSDKTKNKISKANSKITVINGITYNSRQEAADALGVSTLYISRFLKRNIN